MKCITQREELKILRGAQMPSRWGNEMVIIGYKNEEG
jgi:hypothetical protein